MSEGNMESRTGMRKDYLGAACYDLGETVDYRVLDTDMKIILSTNDKKRAERLAENIGGHVHPSVMEK